MANGFNPAQSFAQGRKIGQQAKIGQLQQSLSGQIRQGGFDPAQSLDFQELTVLDPDQAAKISTTFQALSKDRKQAYFDDIVKGRKFLEAGDNQSFSDLFANRIEAIEKLKGDPSGALAVLNKFNSGDLQGTISGLKAAEEAGRQLGFLKDPRTVSVQSSKILDDGTIIQVLKGGARQVISTTGEVLTGTAARDAVATSRDQAFNRKKELKRLEQTIQRSQAKEGVLTAQQKLIQSGNIKRLGELSKTSSGRLSAVKKATKFKLALDKGEVQSGAGRIGASFIPGVFTKQAQFDEEFNAFAEVAARQQLKAAGETKPTDADVEGMKRAMFGIGRDEQVNIILLNDFINAQKQETGELDQLIEASKGGSLSAFTFTAQTPNVPITDIKSLSDDELFN